MACFSFFLFLCANGLRLLVKLYFEGFLKCKRYSTFLLS